MRPDRLLALGVVLLWSVGLAGDTFDSWVARTRLPVLVQEVSAEVRDRDGRLLRAYTVGEGRWRLAVMPDQVDPGFLRALIAYEDKRFHSHAGVDPLALIRSAGLALRHGRILSGGSTLTMQVARLLEDSGTGRWSGKLRQIRVALALERQLSKDEILALYLLVAPYGGNIEGIRAASLAWLGREPRRLTPAEAALLVALPQAPEARRPDRHPGQARAARDRVLRRLADAGVLQPGALAAALRDPAPDRRHAFPALAPHLADRAVAKGPGRRHDLTLEAGLQSRLETLARETMQGRDPRLSLAILVADHASGEVLASVGSAAYGTAGEGYVDMTVARRSPGSTLKPLVYALAFDRGLAHPETLIDDAPVRFGAYAPQNFDGAFRGEIRVSQALQLSLNIPVVLLAEALGPAHLMAALRKAGTAPEVPGGKAGLAVSLGGVGMTLEEVVQLYATLARGGAAVDLHWRQGEVPEGARVVSERAAWQVGHILAGVPPPPDAPRFGIAYKTGTSYGHRDAWAIGFDGRHVIGVWMGRPDGTPVPGAFGADVAAPVLFRAFQRLKSAPDALPGPPPDALLLGNAALPRPLQRFRPRHGQRAGGRGVEMAFPPDGARLPLLGTVPIKLRDGRPPFTILVNGRVKLTGLRRSEVLLDLAEPGFSVLSVIDATGASDRVHVTLR